MPRVSYAPSVDEQYLQDWVVPATSIVFDRVTHLSGYKSWASTAFLATGVSLIDHVTVVAFQCQETSTLTTFLRRANDGEQPASDNSQQEQPQQQNCGIFAPSCDVQVYFHDIDKRDRLGASYFHSQLADVWHKCKSHNAQNGLLRVAIQQDAECEDGRFRINAWQVLDDCPIHVLALCFQQVAVRLNPLSVCRKKEHEILQKLLATHCLVKVSPVIDHVHSKVRRLEDIYLPITLECLFVRRRDCPGTELRLPAPPGTSSDPLLCRSVSDCVGVQFEKLECEVTDPHCLIGWPWNDRLSVMNWQAIDFKDCKLVRVNKDVYEVQPWNCLPPTVDDEDYNHSHEHDESLPVPRPGVSAIPRLIHLIWVGDAPPPTYVWENMMKWKQLLCCHWQVRLWTNGDLSLREFEAEVLDKVHQCQKGAQKADVLRYAVLKKYGGVYMDCDMTPVQSLDPVLSKFWFASALASHERTPFDWAYLTNAFMACTPDHVWMKNALKLALGATLNTADVNMHTGPLCAGSAALRCGVFLLLLPTSWFYRPKGMPYNPRAVVANHEWAATWTRGGKEEVQGV